MHISIIITLYWLKSQYYSGLEPTLQNEHIWTRKVLGIRIHTIIICHALGSLTNIQIYSNILTYKYSAFSISGKSHALCFECYVNKEALKKNNPRSKGKFLNVTHAGRNRLCLLVGQL